MNDKQRYTWLEIVRLAKAPDFVGEAYSDAISVVDAHLSALESLLMDEQPQGDVMSREEWRGLSPESRHKLSVLGQDALTLATLVSTYITADGLRKTTPEQVIETMIKTARKFTPQPATVLLEAVPDKNGHLRFDKPASCGYDHYLLRIDGYSTCPECGAI